MKINENGGWLGEYDIIIRHRNGDVTRERLRNRLTNAGLDLLRDTLRGTVSDAEIKYIALGDSDVAIDDAQTTLDNELFRKEFIQKATVGTGRLQSTVIIQDDEAVFHIREIGIFAGASATSSADTGVMMSRLLWSRDKTDLESIQVVRTDTIQRA